MSMLTEKVEGPGFKYMTLMSLLLSITPEVKYIHL